jgi:hypothetical protein
MLQYKFRIDSWDNELFLLFVDNDSIFTVENYSVGRAICGAVGNAWGAWNEYNRIVSFVSKHTTKLVTIVLTSNLDEDANSVLKIY